MIAAQHLITWPFSGTEWGIVVPAGILLWILVKKWAS